MHRAAMPVHAIPSLDGRRRGAHQPRAPDAGHGDLRLLDLLHVAEAALGDVRDADAAARRRAGAQAGSEGGRDDGAEVAAGTVLVALHGEDVALGGCVVEAVGGGAGGGGDAGGGGSGCCACCRLGAARRGEQGCGAGGFYCGAARRCR